MTEKLTATHKCANCGAQWQMMPKGVDNPDIKGGCWMLVSPSNGNCCANGPTPERAKRLPTPEIDPIVIPTAEKS